MLPAKKLKLQKLISEQFGKGINKKDLFTSLEGFIDDNYHEVKGKTYLSELVREMEAVGGYRSWKKQLRLGILSELLSAGLISLHPPYAGGLNHSQRKAQRQHREKIRQLLSKYQEGNHKQD